jgi:2-polyprenyl-6-methoxyphenol hydroxylase-like FAD-dependent oxidoreductase
MDELTGGRAVTVYGQTELVKDLINARLATDAPLHFDCSGVAVAGIDTDSPHVTYQLDGERHELRAEVIAGCDGFHGVCRTAIPADVLKVWEREYPFAWLGILADVAPSTDELIYARTSVASRCTACARPASAAFTSRWRPMRTSQLAGPAHLGRAARASGTRRLDAASRAR